MHFSDPLTQSETSLIKKAYQRHVRLSIEDPRNASAYLHLAIFLTCINIILQKKSQQNKVNQAKKTTQSRQWTVSLLTIDGRYQF